MDLGARNLEFSCFLFDVSLISFLVLFLVVVLDLFFLLLDLWWGGLLALNGSSLRFGISILFFLLLVLALARGGRFGGSSRSSSSVGFTRSLIRKTDGVCLELVSEFLDNLFELGRPKSKRSVDSDLSGMSQNVRIPAIAYAVVLGHFFPVNLDLTSMSQDAEDELELRVGAVATSRSRCSWCHGTEVRRRQS